MERVAVSSRRGAVLRLSASVLVMLAVFLLCLWPGPASALPLVRSVGADSDAPEMQCQLFARYIVIEGRELIILFRGNLVFDQIDKAGLVVFPADIGVVVDAADYVKDKVGFWTPSTLNPTLNNVGCNLASSRDHYRLPRKNGNTACFWFVSDSISQRDLFLFEFNQFFGDGKLNPQLCLESWSLANVLYMDVELDVAFEVAEAELGAWLAFFDHHPGPLVGEVSFSADADSLHSGLCGAPRKDQGGSQGHSTQDAQAELPSAQHDHLDGRLGAGLLGNKIVLLTLLGGGAAGVAGWGLALALIGGGWRRWFGSAVCVSFLFVRLTIWSRPVYGSPLTYWKLWGPSFRACWYICGQQDEGSSKPPRSCTA